MKPVAWISSDEVALPPEAIKLLARLRLEHKPGCPFKISTYKLEKDRLMHHRVVARARDILVDKGLLVAVMKAKTRGQSTYMLTKGE